MRRALSAIAMTIAGIVLVARFQSSPITHRASASGAASVSGPASGGSTTPSTTTPSTTPGLGPSGQFSGPGGGQQNLGGDGSSSTPSTTAPAGSGPLKDGTFTGAQIDTRFGPVQVQAVVSGGRITDVTELEAPSDRPRSQEINGYAAPILHDEVLSAQSAQIDQVSGATITWDAYSQSLQAALDAARQ